MSGMKGRERKKEGRKDSEEKAPERSLRTNSHIRYKRREKRKQRD